MARAHGQPIQPPSPADEAFLTRMQAQCEQIEAYRLEVLRREGRKLNLDQAAREWIARYAQDYSQ